MDLIVKPSNGLGNTDVKMEVNKATIARDDNFKIVEFKGIGTPPPVRRCKVVQKGVGLIPQHDIILNVGEVPAQGGQYKINFVSNLAQFGGKDEILDYVAGFLKILDEKYVSRIGYTIDIENDPGASNIYNAEVIVEFYENIGETIQISGRMFNFIGVPGKGVILTGTQKYRARLAVNVDIDKIPQSGGYMQISVQSNDAWHIDNNTGNELTINPNSGNGDKSRINIEYTQPNTGRVEKDLGILEVVAESYPFPRVPVYVKQEMILMPNTMMYINHEFPSSGGEYTTNNLKSNASGFIVESLENADDIQLTAIINNSESIQIDLHDGALLTIPNELGVESEYDIKFVITCPEIPIKDGYSRGFNLKNKDSNTGYFAFQILQQDIYIKANRSEVLIPGFGGEGIFVIESNSSWEVSDYGTSFQYQLSPEMAGIGQTTVTIGYRGENTGRLSRIIAQPVFTAIKDRSKQVSVKLIQDGLYVPMTMEEIQLNFPYSASTQEEIDNHPVNASGFTILLNGSWNIHGASLVMIVNDTTEIGVPLISQGQIIIPDGLGVDSNYNIRFRMYMPMNSSASYRSRTIFIQSNDDPNGVFFIGIIQAGEPN